MYVAKKEEYYFLAGGFTLMERYHIYIINKRLKRNTGMKTKTWL